MKKLTKLHVSSTWMAVLSLLALLAALLPLYRLTMYAIPRYDDYSYGIKLWQNLRYGIGPRAMLEAGFSTVLDCHYSWQGTYSSIFMMAQMPAAFGFEYYFLGPILLISSLTISSFVLIWTLTRRFFNATWQEAVLSAVIVTMAMLELIHTAQQGFYWYNSGVHYTFMHSMFFLMTSCCIQLFFVKKKRASILWSLLLIPLSFVCAGANFVTCLQGLLVLIAAFLLAFIKSRKHCLWFVPSFITYLVGFYLNVTAPGNAVRAAWYQGDSAFPAILHSYGAAVKQLWRFTGVYMLLFALLALPVIYNLVQRSTFSFRLPGLFLFFAFSFYATGFTSSFYSMGNAGLSRTWIAIKLTCQLLFFACEVYGVGYCVRLLEKKQSVVSSAGHLEHRIWYYALLMLLFLIAFRFTKDKIGSVSSFGAYYYVHSGEANNFHNEFLDRVSMIQCTSDPVVAVPSYQYMPWFLINKDISEDSNEEENRMMAKYFGKDQLYRLPPSQ
ncbi:MAG: DUF6056 family protein [Lachnospiraceae bacterium]|nr:DUF6056 family protein [Lachnospiraceae bacterium]